MDPVSAKLRPHHGLVGPYRSSFWGQLHSVLLGLIATEIAHCRFQGSVFIPNDVPDCRFNINMWFHALTPYLLRPGHSNRAHGQFAAAGKLLNEWLSRAARCTPPNPGCFPLSRLECHYAQLSLISPRVSEICWVK